MTMTIGARDAPDQPATRRPDLGLLATSRGRSRRHHSDGVRVGAVQETLADEPSQIFDGIVIDTRLGPGGLRVVDSSQVAGIYMDRVVLTVPHARVHDLPRPRKHPRT
jgi:hypothetical protein